MNKDFRDGWNEAIDHAEALLMHEVSRMNLEPFSLQAKTAYARVEMIKTLKLAVKENSSE